MKNKKEKSIAFQSIRDMRVTDGQPNQLGQCLQGKPLGKKLWNEMNATSRHDLRRLTLLAEMPANGATAWLHNEKEPRRYFFMKDYFGIFKTLEYEVIQISGSQLREQSPCFTMDE